MKIVDRGEYSLILEKNEDDVDGYVCHNGENMRVVDVARQLGMSRHAVTQTLRTTIRKIYKDIRKETKADSIQIMCVLADLFNVKDEKEYRQFFNLFPKDAKGEVYDTARETGYTH
jgi:hypothetical protein